MTFWSIFLLLPWKRCRHFIHISTRYDFLCKLSSVEISNLREMSKLVVWEKIRKQFMNWSSAELAQRVINKGSTGQRIVDMLHFVGDMCRFRRSECAVYLGLRWVQIPLGRFSFLFEGAQIYIQPDHYRSVIKIKDFRSAPNWITTNLRIAIIVLSNIISFFKWNVHWRLNK